LLAIAGIPFWLESLVNSVTELKQEVTRSNCKIMDKVTMVESELKQEVKAVKQEVTRSNCNIMDKLQRPVVSKSPCLLGQLAMDDLAENKLLKKFVPTAGSRPVFNDEEYNKMQALTQEEALVEKIIERIQILMPNRKVVSSEKYPWLVTYKGSSSFNQKPDICVANAAFFDIKGTRRTLPLGIPADPSLYVGVSLIDFKVRMTDHSRGLGEAIMHSEYLAHNYVRHNNSMFVFNHAVAYREAIFLFKFRDAMLEAMWVPWNGFGSADLLIEHFRERDPISRVLEQVLAMKKLQLHQGPCAFLGAGATGMVFRVLDPELHKEYALKIVIGKDNVELLKRVVLKCGPTPVKIFYRLCLQKFSPA
jgi:hypothetical protein